MISLLIATVIVLIILSVYLFMKRSYSPSFHNLPGMEPQIFFGNLLNSGLLSEKSTFLEILLAHQHRYGDKFVFWFGSQPWLVLCRPEHAQAVYVDRYTFEQTPLNTPNFDLLCPNGLLLLSGAKWKRHARSMVPMFKRAKVLTHFDTIIHLTDRFIDQHLHNGQIHRNLTNCCQTLTMNILGCFAFGDDFDMKINSPLRIALHYFLSIITFMAMASWLPRWLCKLYLKLDWKYQRARRSIDEFIEKLIKKEQDNQCAMSSQQSKNLLASLILSQVGEINDEQISSALTREEIFDEILMIILAGHDTTAIAISWFIFFISKNPRVQQSMKEELQKHNLLMTDNAECVPDLTEENLASLIYCECVMKEVLRLAPTTTHTTRIALQDTMIDNVPISRGQTIILAHQNMSRDSRYWHHADPNQFVPERFLGKDKNHHSYAMNPFGGGHRACIGENLAWLELKLIFIRLMQRGVVFEDTDENTGGYDEAFTSFPKNLVVRVRID